VRYELGEWCDKIQEASSIRNLANAMLQAAQEESLDGCEVLLYTDNQTAEGAYFRGTAKIEALFELIITLYKFQVQFDFILHVVWITGMRMIQQGTDGLSRGEEKGLEICGISLGWMVPLHLSATTRSSMLEDWIRGWADTGRNLEVLKPMEWFTLAHILGSFGWFPAPAVVDEVIYHFCDALHKRPNCFHVFAIPLLMANRWREQLLKAMDVYFALKADIMIWDNSQHDPLGIFIYLPVSRHGPWCPRRPKPVVDLVYTLREVPEEYFLQNENLLRQFLRFTRQLETMPEGLARELLHPLGRRSLPGAAPEGRER
jgi:hypothetical protein